MELIDILSIEKWIELEKECVEQSSLDVSVFNIKGIRITDYKHWANKLCKAIKATDKGQSFICAVAHMNLATITKNTKKSIIEECDAGFVKLVVPIFVKNEFIGAVGACGLLLDEAEADEFLINKTTEIDEKTIDDLSININKITYKEVEKLEKFISLKLNSIVKIYESK